MITINRCNNPVGSNGSNGANHLYPLTGSNGLQSLLPYPRMSVQQKDSQGEL
jgi:hypothetical protein